MRLSDVDFMRPPGQPVAAWWLLAAGALALAGSLGLAQHERLQRDDAAAREQALFDARLARLQPAAALPPTPAQRRWIQSQPQLTRPWKAAMGAIESATHDPVYLLSMSIDPSAGIIRLEGEAPGFDQALAYVQALQAQPAIASATLESHAAASGSAAPGTPAPVGSLVHFSATAHWRLP